MKCNSMINREILTGLISHNFYKIKRIWKAELICLENNDMCSYLTKKEQSRLRKLMTKKKKFFKKSEAWALTANPFSVPLLPMHYNCRSFFEPISTGGVIFPDDLPILFGYGFKGRDMDLEIKSLNKIIHSEEDYADITWLEADGSALHSYIKTIENDIKCDDLKYKVVSPEESIFKIEDLSIDKEDDLTGHGIVVKDGHTMIVKDYPIDCSVGIKAREASFNAQDFCNKMIKPVIDKILNKGRK